MCIATCYLWKYWEAFGVNVFEYASISDVAARAVLPVAAAVVPVVVGASFAEITPLEQILPAGGGRDSHTGVFLRKWARLLFGLCVITGLAVLSTLHSPLRWVSASLFFIPVAFVVERQPLLADLIPEGRARRVLTMLGISAVFVSIGAGEKNADEILRGDSERVVDESSVGVPLKATQAHPVEYIGYVGGSYFLYETQTRSVVIIKQADHTALVLKPRIVSRAQTSN
jgi:hypothetical protein